MTANAAGAAVRAGTPIVNSATLTYDDARGNAFTSVSNTVVETVAAVSGTTLGPNEFGCNATADTVSATGPTQEVFRISNGGNVADSFVVSAANATAGRIVSLAFVQAGQAIPATLGTTQSPPVQPGGGIGLAVTIDASSVSVGSKIELTVSVASKNGSAQNGQTVATAMRCAIPAAPASFAAPDGSSSAISKLVNGLPASSSTTGGTVSYRVSFVNGGGVAAQDVVLDDPVPTGIVPIPSTVTVDGIAVSPSSVTTQLSGQEVLVALGDVAAKATVVVDFNATVTASYKPGPGIVNVANLRAKNANAIRSVPAAVNLGVANVVFDGTAGAGSPVAGATVTLIRANGEKAATTPVVAAGPAVAPNVKNADPFVTDATGTYGLGIAASQTSAGATFELIVAAPGYTTRRLRLTLAPDPTGSFYSAAVTALDGEPLAIAGSFELASGAVTIPSTYGLFGNIPMFRPQSVALTKLVDRTAASAGDRLIYTIGVRNVGDALGAATVQDDLPVGITYASGTSLVDGVPQEPSRSGRMLAWNFSDLRAAHAIQFAAAVLPSAGDNTQLTNVATVAAHVSTSATYLVTARASATTDVVSGAFSPRSIVGGRVYLDRDGSASFDAHDTGIGGVRIYLEDGESVTTDAYGKYDFPSVRPGMHVVRLDATTLPPFAAAPRGERIDDERSPRRLVHGTYDSGLIEIVDFAVPPKDAPR